MWCNDEASYGAVMQPQSPRQLLLVHAIMQDPSSVQLYDPLLHVLPDLFEVALAPLEGVMKDAQRCKVDQLSFMFASSLLLICHHLMAAGIPALQPLSISQVRPHSLVPLYFRLTTRWQYVVCKPMLSAVLVNYPALHPVSLACLLTS
jgi:hypothetical protein